MIRVPSDGMEQVLVSRGCMVPLKELVEGYQQECARDIEEIMLLSAVATSVHSGSLQQLWLLWTCQLGVLYMDNFHIGMTDTVPAYKIRLQAMSQHH